MVKNYPKRAYGRKGYKTYKKVNKIKKMVTGDGPTMVEKIASGIGGVATLAKAVLPIIGAINTEMKYFDQTAATNAYSPGVNDVLTGLSTSIIQGTSDSQRIGNSILAKDLQLRMAINFTSSTGVPNINGIHCRALLIAWKENAQQNAPSIAKIFEAPSNLYSPVNKDNSDSFMVIKDKFFTLNATNTNSGTAGFSSMKWFKKLDYHMRFLDAGANPTQNHIYLILRSSATGLSNALQVTYYSRLNYTDN